MKAQSFDGRCVVFFERPSLVVTQSPLLPTFSPLYGKVEGVAIYSIHILYSTVNIIFGQKLTTDRYVCECMHLYELF